MRSINRSQKAFFIVASMLFTCIAIGAVAVWRSSARQKPLTRQDNTAEEKQQLQARIRDGVGREVNFTSDGSPKGIRDSVNSLEKFISKRSGIKFGAGVKKKLADMEFSTLRGSNRRISVTELDEVLAEVALHRLATLTDAEIKHADETLRGFVTDDMPDREHGRRMLILPGMLVQVSPEKFTERMKYFRAESTSGSNELMKGAIHNFVDRGLRQNASRLSEALPEHFGGVWDLANDRDGAGMTPLQALAFTYSYASGDLLCDSEENLDKHMRGLQRALTKLRGAAYPMPDGHLAFGPNGYITSTPLDIVFDDDTLSFLLDRIRERSGR